MNEGPSCVPALPDEPVSASMQRTYQRLREIPAQFNLLGCGHEVRLTTRAGLVMHVMRDPTIMDILRQELNERMPNADRG
jgi:hypothetical protein